MHYTGFKRYILKPCEMEEFQVSSEIEFLAEIVKDKLYFGVTYTDKAENIKNTCDNFYFSIDEEFLYQNYYLDFGPLNISCLYKYCLKLYSYMQCPHIQKIIHYTTKDPNKRVNAAYLIGSYCTLFLNMDPKFIYRKLLDSGGPFKSFLDASQGISKYTLKLSEVLQGVQRAHSLNFFDFNDFNVTEYDLYDKIQNGDFNWLVPRKFIALIGPIDKEVSPNGHSPNFYIRYFLKNDVRTVIRLNNKLYNAHIFEKAGIDHYDLFFPDGTTPPKQVLLKFLEIAENAPGAIAVHCKAGLGRTGSLIGAYIIKHYKFSAKEAIAWMRVCRPGSVIGQQQGWLEKIEPWLWKQGTVYRLEHFGEADRIPHHKFGIYSKAWQIQKKKFLLLAHKRTQSEEPLPTRQIKTNIPYNEYDVYSKGYKKIKDKEGSYKSIKDSLGGHLKNYQSKPFEYKTQGDKLNEIKMKKYLSSLVNTVNESKSKTRDYYKSYVKEHSENLNSDYCQFLSKSKNREKPYYKSDK